MSDYQSYTPPPPTVQTNTMALVSLIAGILGWSLLPTLGSIVAIITGHMAKTEIKNNPGKFTGDGMATAGLILGYANIVIVVIALCLVIVLPLLGLGGVALCAPFSNSFYP
jgi:hypothetical protein